MLRVGIDENGLGPRLGPLVVTGAFARADARGERRIARVKRSGLSARLGDSKKLVAFGDSALGEAWARALARRLGLPARSPDELVHLLSIDAKDSLRSRCPAGHVEHCWGAAEEGFVTSEEEVAQAEEDLERLERGGVAVIDVRVAIVCNERLNAAAVSGLSRFDVDLHTMERITALAHGRDHEGEVKVICGKVGGFDRYGERFRGPLSGRLHVALVEGRAKSEYRFPGLGTVAFLRDAEERDLLVALASLVGKWVRDLLMTRIVRYHRADVPELPMASGYHDPVTTRFIEATALSRKRSGLPDLCFERSKKDDLYEEAVTPLRGRSRSGS